MWRAVNTKRDCSSSEASGHRSEYISGFRMGRNGYPLQYSCLVNSKDRGAWQVQSVGSQKNWTQLSTHTGSREGSSKKQKWDKDDAQSSRRKNQRYKESLTSSLNRQFSFQSTEFFKSRENTIFNLMCPQLAKFLELNTKTLWYVWMHAWIQEESFFLLDWTLIHTHKKNGP